MWAGRAGGRETVKPVSTLCLSTEWVKNRLGGLSPPTQPLTRPPSHQRPYIRETMHSALNL